VGTNVPLVLEGLHAGLQYSCARRRSTAAAGSPLPARSGRAAAQFPRDSPGSGRHPDHRRADPDFHPGALLASHRLGCPLTVPSDPVLVVVLGPTGSGKTALSLALAEQFRGEIVNCDSVAMYREFEIGTAKPTSAERARVPHHLLDFVDPAADITAGEYARQARAVLRQIKLRGALPIVVGGTGLYLRALLEGLFAGPQRSEELRRRLRDDEADKGAGYLHRILTRLDPAAASKVHANDTPKLVRAVEVCLASRTRMSEMWKQGRNPLQGFRIMRLGLDPERNALYQRINDRARRMFDAGLVEETRTLLEKFGEASRPLAALGYKQAVALVRGKIDLRTAVQAAEQAQRNYAKRQMTWFRREPEVTWLAGFGDEPAVQAAAIRQIADTKILDK
jgi:tRNA dimethylallyltransferase